MEDLLMKYFQSWQGKADFDLMRSCLKDDFIFDSNMGLVEGADQLINFLKNNEKPWKDVQVISSIVAIDKACLFYQGTEIHSGKKIRVAESIEFKDQLIAKVIAVISELSHN